ncbi:MAG TPA: hypothetical protein VD704_02685 [Gaiellaceae bacterium]|nr:hypothetical protein [Gaiellaceae bacterium]
MNRWTQIAVAAGVVAVAVVLFVVLRPDDEDDETDAAPAAETTTPETTTEETTTEEAAETEETTTEEAPTTTQEGPQRLVVRVDGSGQPVGGVQRFEVERDERVVLVVRSQVSDHMHLHGYDFIADVAPGQPGCVTFRADMRGRFELELEDRAILIAELEVR